MGDIKEMQAPARERRLLILGAGGFGRVVYELAEELGIYYGIAFLDDAAQGEKVVGKLEDYQKLSGEYTHAIVAIGKNALRLHAFVSDRHFYFMRVVKADIRNPLRYL